MPACRKTGRSRESERQEAPRFAGIRLARTRSEHGLHMPGASASASDSLSPACEVIEVRVAELKQLFNAIDPSPFREKDLDPNAEEFIVSWARDAHRDAPLALLVHVDRAPGPEEEHAVLCDAIRMYFAQRSAMSMRRLRRLFRIGRTNLLIGLAFLAGSLLLGDVVANALDERRLGQILRESLLIGGWVAMWRPMEIFLYDWWPIRAETKLFDRLSAMPVRIAQTREAEPRASRCEGPVVLPTPQHDTETASSHAAAVRPVVGHVH